MKAEHVVKLVEEYKAAGVLAVRVEAVVSLATKSGDNVALSCTAADARLLASCIEVRRSELQAYLEGRATPPETETSPALTPAEPGKKRPKVREAVLAEWARAPLTYAATPPGDKAMEKLWQEWAAARDFKWGSVRNVLNELRSKATQSTNPAAPAAQPNAQEA